MPKHVGRAVTLLVLKLAAVVLAFGWVELRAPAALAFPHERQIGETVIYSDGPIPFEIGSVMARADELLSASPVNVPGIKRQIVLTDSRSTGTTLSRCDVLSGTFSYLTEATLKLTASPMASTLVAPGHCLERLHMKRSI